MRAVYNLVERVAPSDIAVLISGETGVGKRSSPKRFTAPRVIGA